MTILRRALQSAAAAARANLLPGILLQCLMVVFLSAYVAHEGTRIFLAEVARVRQETGYLFAFVSYATAAALLPEILRIAFFQGGRPTRRNLWLFVTAAPAWGCLGIIVDFFYRCQTGWFGSGTGLMTILPKVLVDQLLFSPLISNPLTIAWFIWRDERFHSTAWRKIFRPGFYMDRIFPVQVSGWIIWIPGVALVYSMPPLLQIPVAVLIQAFWAMVFTTLGEARDKTL